MLHVKKKDRQRLPLAASLAKLLGAKVTVIIVEERLGPWLTFAETGGRRRIYRANQETRCERRSPTSELREMAFNQSEETD
jgi:hypothetical protein